MYTPPRSMDDIDSEFRDHLARRISSYARRRDELLFQRAEIESEVEDVERRLRSAEQLYEAEYGLIPTGSRAERTTVHPGSQASGPMTGLAWGDALVRILAERGPLHVKQIWALLQDGEFRTAARDPLRSIVAIALREPGVIRVAPNTYALNSAAQTRTREGSVN